MNIVEQILNAKYWEYTTGTVVSVPTGNVNAVHIVKRYTFYNATETDFHVITVGTTFHGDRVVQVTYSDGLEFIENDRIGRVLLSMLEG